jgi:hypothetical protein
MTNTEGTEELRDRLAVIAMATENFVGVNQVEHLLVDLVAFLKSGRVERAAAAEALIGLIEPWPGAPEVLEFTMRVLQWPEVRVALEEHVASESGFRTRDLAASVLQVCEDGWPGGEIYRTYRGP